MSQPAPIRIASYNLRKCVGTDRRRDPGRIIAVLNALKADVIALQEADRRLGARPAALPAEMIARETDMISLSAEDGPSLGWHGNALLVRKGLEAGPMITLDLPGTEPRGAVAARINGLLFVGVHLGLMRRDRRRQLGAILKRLAPLGGPSLIAGDFNEWSLTGRGLEPLAREFTIISPGLSFHSAHPVAPLDRFALGPAIRLKRAGVLETPLSRRASDHLPIWAELQHLPDALPAPAKGAPAAGTAA